MSRTFDKIRSLIGSDDLLRRIP